MIYLDNAASTKPLFRPINSSSNLWMNSNAGYYTNSLQELRICEQKIKNFLGVKKGHIVFTRSASECASFLINQIYGTITCSPYEHECVYDNDEAGDISKVDLSFIDDTFKHLHFQMLVNNITGEIFDLSKIKQDVKCDFLACDITAAIGKINLPNNIENYCDALFFSGRKIHTSPIGVLWLNDELFRFCSGKNDDIRNNYSLFHGTTDIENVVSLTHSLEFITSGIESNNESWKELNQYLFNLLNRNNIEYDLITPKNKAEYLTLISFPKINAESFQMYCASKDCYIGIGKSTCSTTKNKNRILDLMKIENQDSVIRISYGLTTTSLDIKDFVEILKKYYNFFVI